jgi:peroxiredoxin
MTLTKSKMLSLGTRAPDFHLTDTRGQLVTLASVDASAYLIVFICNHCPYVRHIAAALASLGRECERRGVAMFGINSNDTRRYPADGLEGMRAERDARGYTFPYLLDETQEVARAYHAACTPDFYLFNKSRALVYRGQLDDSRPGSSEPVTGADLRAAIDATLAEQPVARVQHPSIGCNIKWKPGNEPELT